MKQALFAAVSVIALAGTAGAADLPRRMPVPEYVAPAFSWNGFYIGGHAGVAVGKTSTSNNAPYGGFDADVPLSYNLNPVGIFGGGQVGYNWQRGVWVFGVEGDFGYLGLNDSISAVATPGNFVEVQYGWYGTITGRLGVAVYDRLLTYVKGGAAVASITNSAGALAGAVVDPADYSETKKTRWGWTVGTGFEYALNQSWSVKSEYLYMNFGKFNATNIDGDTFTHKNQVHTLKVGLNYRFGGYNAPVVARY